MQKKKKRQTQRTMSLHGFVYMECLNVKINNKKEEKNQGRFMIARGYEGGSEELPQGFFRE